MPNHGCATNKPVQKGINTKTKGRRSVVNGKSKAYKAHLNQGNKNAALEERYAKKQEYENQVTQEQAQAQQTYKEQMRKQALHLQKELGLAGGGEEEAGTETMRRPNSAYLHMRNQRNFLKTVFVAPVNCVKFESNVEEEEVVVFKHRAAMNAYFHRKVSDEEFEENEVLLQELKDRYCPMSADLLAMQQQELAEAQGEEEEEGYESEDGEEEEAESETASNSDVNPGSSSSSSGTVAAAAILAPDETSVEVEEGQEATTAAPAVSGADEVLAGATDRLKIDS
jgi:hypothetical protein